MPEDRYCDTTQHSHGNASKDQNCEIKWLHSATLELKSLGDPDRTHAIHDAAKAPV
jgi:hypothetical protein